MDALRKLTRMSNAHGSSVDAGSTSQRLKLMLITSTFLLMFLQSAEARQYPTLIAVTESAPEPPARLLIRIPDLAINFELKEFTNPAVVIQTVYRRIIGDVPKGWYGLRSWSTSNYGDVMLGLKRGARAKVHFLFRVLIGRYSLNLSEVVSGLALPRLPIPEKFSKMPISFEIDEVAESDL
ncbi:putative 2b protein [Elm mottle virus]|uniref:putative 2b protein n=1 Tax=Elm mottle virus TaxID=56486 RepID=UPI0000161F6F|nr:putative 2b protein [Elm mottle virus]